MAHCPTIYTTTNDMSPVSTMVKKKYLVWFQDCSKSSHHLVGGKNASLGELTRAGIRVPPGFAVTTAAYREFLSHSGLSSEISSRLASLDGTEDEKIQATSSFIREMIHSAEIPPQVEDEIAEGYANLCRDVGMPELPVAVRSSATAEDLPGASFAGQQDTFLWVSSQDNVLQFTVQCWSSLFTSRAISYRDKMGFSHEKVEISVGVQKMANARAAGVMFTLNPANGDRSKIVIEGNWGLGESVVAGVVTPDNFMVDRVTFDILRRKVSPKLVEYLPDRETGQVRAMDIPPERQTALCISDDELLTLARLGKRIDQHYGSPQDIEWAVDDDLPHPENILILQSRPETVWSSMTLPPVSKPSASVLETIVANLLKGKRIDG